MSSGEYGWFKLDTVRQTEKGEVKKIIGTIQKVDESLTDDIGIIREKRTACKYAEFYAVWS